MTGTQRASRCGMNDDDLERRAGKGPEGDHPLDRPGSQDPSDQSDPRVAQPGEDPPDEDAMEPLPDR